MPLYPDIPAAPWIDYTPTLTQGATVTCTVTQARYYKIGRQVTVQVQLRVTGAGTAANAIRIGLPVAHVGGATFMPVGTGSWSDINVNRNYVGQAWTVTSTAVGIVCNNDPDFLGGSTSTTSALAMASPDDVRLDAVYEAAA